MRVGCLQFASRPGEVETNMKKAHDILDKVGKQTSTAVESNLDFLVLPKLAFSGPDFKPGEPGKYETTTTSTQLWAKSAAVKYGCTVVVGYPEVIDARCGQIPEETWFSSSIVIDKFGKTVKNDAERTINKNEPMFSDIKTDFGKITVGQFTDLGEREFSNDPETTAFAEHMLAVDSYAAIISMAWAKEDPGFSSKPPYKPDEYALSCWVARLEPLVEAKRKEETLIVLCNSTGPDTYAGTSAVLGIKDGEVLVYDYLGSSQEGLLVVDTSKNPVHKLSPRRMDPRRTEAGPNLEQDTESLTSADSPQTGPLTPDTSYRGSDTAPEFPHEYDFDVEGAKRLALPAVRVFPTLVTNTLPMRPKTPRAARSRSPRSSDRTLASDPASAVVVDPRAIKRPVSPKSRNAQKLVALKLPTDPDDCGIIPILASPSIMTTSPSTERSRSVGRGRRRKAREPSEENSRSSSRDSTRHGLLHRRI
ncbi:hypothetical protein NHJ13051_003399, partial [Beauveria bassiana]